MAHEEAFASRRGGLTSPGAVAFLTAVAATICAWAFLRPAGFSTGQYAGEVFGVLAVLCLSAALVLATRGKVVEDAFGGLDRMYAWHRWIATSGLVLFVPHLLLVGGGRDAGTPDPSSPALTPNYGLGNLLGTVAIIGLGALALIAFAPRLVVLRDLVRVGYERWLASHRLVGLFVAAAVVHGLFVDPVIRASATLWWIYFAIGVIGIAAFIARQVGDLRGWGRAAYVVAGADQLTPTALEVWLRPVGAPVAFTPGQFVYASFGGPGWWQPHPFTISSAPDAGGGLRLSVRAGGDYTTRLHRYLTPGIRATIEGPYGAFHHDLGKHRQVWIAGGIGITPFLSWIGDDGGAPPDVDLFYAVPHAGDALYVDEIAGAAARIPGLRLHLSTDDRDGFLTADRIQAALPYPLADCSVFMCGPAGMIRALDSTLRAKGVPSAEIHYEEFSFR